MPRQTTGRPRGPATRTPAPHKPNARKQKKRAQNALAIAEHEIEEKAGFSRSRMGQLEPGPRKRARDDDDENEDSDGDGRHKRAKADLRERYGKGAEYLSDSDGNDVVIGEVNDEDDDSLDSDEAFGESDEERFAGFSFRGSSSQKNAKRSSKAPKQGGFLDEDDESQDEELDSGEESDNFKENAVDMMTVFDDDNFDDEDSDDGAEKSKKRPSKKQSVSDSDDSDEDADDESASDDDQQSEFSMSDEDEEETQHRTNLLKDLVAGFDTGDKTQDREDKARIRAQEAMDPSIAPAGSTVDFLSALEDPSLRALLGPTVKGSKRSGQGIPGVVEAPLPQRQQGRLDRAAAYDKNKEELNKWVDTVKHNRRAEHLVFPLHNADEASAKNTGRLQPLTDGKPFNELEAMIQDIQFKTGMAPTTEKTEDDEEDGGLQLEGVPEKQLTLAEVKARNAELRKAREVLFREEHKAKRIKKIKSKSYRRVHRKERERDLQKQQQADAEAGIIPEEDDQERADRLRAEERMGAKHRESKWAKAMKATGRAKWDADARGDVIEMARREEELKRRMLGETIHADGSGEEEQSDFDSDLDPDEANTKTRNELFRLQDDQEPAGKVSKLHSMDFMKNAEARRRAQNEEDIQSELRRLDGKDTEDESDGAEKPRRQMGPRKDVGIALPAKEQRGEFEERDDSDNERNPAQAEDESDVEIVTKSEARNAKQPGRNPQRNRGLLSQDSSVPSEPAQDVQGTSNPWMSVPKRSNKKASAILATENQLIDADVQKTVLPSAKQVAAAKVQPAKAARKQIRLLSAEDDDGTSSSGSSDDEPRLTTQRGMVKTAFAGDAAVTDFEAEKVAAAREERSPSPVADILPGWGSWAGSGLNKKDRRERKRRDERLEKQVKDNFAASKGGKKGKVDQTRKDANLKGVIISEKRLPKTTKYLASALPHTFETKAQYERSLRLPMGPEWVTKETHQAGTKPRILMGGGIIRPMEKPLV